MDISIKENGNALINGKEYIPMSRLEEDIDEAVAYGVRKKIIKTIAFIAAIIVSFAFGYVMG